MITVNPNPAPVVTISMANDTICRFDTLNLTASGASTYQWSTPAKPNLSTLATATDVPLNTTTYTVVGMDALGCPSQPTTQTIVVGRRPTINAFNNSNVTVCSGGSSTLTVNATSGVGGGGGGGVTLAYQWNPNVGTTNTVTVSPTVTTLYTVTVVGQFGCSTTDTTTVNVNPNAISPIISVTPDSVNFCQGTTGHGRFNCILKRIWCNLFLVCKCRSSNYSNNRNIHRKRWKQYHYLYRYRNRSIKWLLFIS